MIRHGDIVKTRGFVPVSGARGWMREVAYNRKREGYMGLLLVGRVIAFGDAHVSIEVPDFWEPLHLPYDDVVPL